MEKWEYMSFKIETEGLMGDILDIENFNVDCNKFGEQGWELVSCVSTNMVQVVTRDVIAFFKMRK